MKNTITGELNCYGCSGAVCKDPPSGWLIEEENSARCTAASEGCRLKS